MAKPSKPVSYGIKSGFTNKKAPYPSPEIIQEAQANLEFFRKQIILPSGKEISQAQIAKEFDLDESTWSLWEHDGPERTSYIKATLVKPVAERLKCNPDLINPACPLSSKYKNTYNKYPPVFSKTKGVVQCKEHPETANDFINNFCYFWVLSGKSSAYLAQRLGCAKGSISRWASDTLLKESIAIDLANLLDCPKELIYLPKIEQPKDGRMRIKVDKGLKRITPVRSLNDAKNNLAYYVQRAQLSAKDVARMLGLGEGAKGEQTYRNWISPRTKSYMDNSQALCLANRLNISVNDILPVYEQYTDVSLFCSNITGYRPIAIPVEFGNMEVQSFVSGGAILELEPSQIKETISDVLHIPQNCSSIAAATVVGDSMFNYDECKGIADGTCILIDTSQRDFHKLLNKVVCFQVNGNELLVKRLKKIDGKLCFWSDNPRCVPRYHPMPEDAVLLGRVKQSFNPVD